MIKRTSWLALTGIAALGIMAALLAFILLRMILQYHQSVRGVALGVMPSDMPLRSSGSPYGVAVALEQDQVNLDRSLDLAQQGGFLWLRQRFPWKDIEPQRGVFAWQPYDRLVDAATTRGFKLIATLDTSPAWARSATTDTSPPDNLEDYGNFVAAFVEHYRGRVSYIQVWDEPNVAPHWGEQWVSPDEYVGMLKIAYARAKAANPNVQVLAGGLAPTVADDQWNLNDVTFLSRMYAKGAKGYFDILAAKPYGFWTGPDDRRVDPSILNFSRLILLREIMVKNNDVARPIWAVAMGWNALPTDWKGRPSPWGTDSEAVQAQRTVDALKRAQAEWPWLDVLIINGLRFPTAAPDDPVRGFALLDDNFEPRSTYRAVQALARQPLVADVGRYAPNTHAIIYSPDWAPVDEASIDDPLYRSDHGGAELTIRFRGTGIEMFVLRQPSARLLVWIDDQPVDRLPRDSSGVSFVDADKLPGQGMTSIILADTLPDTEHVLRLQTVPWLGNETATLGGFAVVRIVSATWMFVGWGLLALGILLCLAGVAVLMPRLPWPDWDLAVDRLPAAALCATMVVLVGVYYLGPLPVAILAALAFAALALSRLDMALAVTVLTFPFYLYPRHVGGQVFSLPEVLTLLCFAAYLGRGLGKRKWGFDGAFRLPVLFFLIVAMLSLRASADLRLSLRELRTVVIEPVLFYVMAVAAFGRDKRSLPRSALVWALVLAGSAAALQALGQYIFAGRVITAEGVHRAVGPYGSPNNLGLLLERVLPLSLAMAMQASSLPDGAGRTLSYRSSPTRLAIFLLAAFCLLLIALALFLTYSIGAWLGAVVGILVFAALRGRRQVIAVIVALAIVGLMLLPWLQVDRVVSHLGLQGQTTSIRVDLWRSSLAMIADHPLEGVGLDGFLELYHGVYILPTALREPFLSHPHNLALEWWVFLGIGGIPALVWFVVRFFRLAWRSLAHLQPQHAVLVQGAMAGMAAAITHGLVDRFYFGAPDLAFIFFTLLVIGELKSGAGVYERNTAH